MFNERKVICLHLVIFLILPLLDNNKDLKLIIFWAICSCLLFIFPFLSPNLEDSLLLM